MSLELVRQPVEHCRPWTGTLQNPLLCCSMRQNQSKWNRKLSNLFFPFFRNKKNDFLRPCEPNFSDHLFLSLGDSFSASTSLTRDSYFHPRKSLTSFWPLPPFSHAPHALTCNESNNNGNAGCWVPQVNFLWESHSEVIKATESEFNRMVPFFEKYRISLVGPEKMAAASEA